MADYFLKMVNLFEGLKNTFESDYRELPGDLENAYISVYSAILMSPNKHMYVKEALINYLNTLMPSDIVSEHPVIKKESYDRHVKTVINEIIEGIEMGNLRGKQLPFQ